MKKEKVVSTSWKVGGIFCALTILLFVMMYHSSSSNSVFFWICLFAIFAVNVAAFYLYDRQIEKYKAKEENDRLELQNQYRRNQLEIMNKTSEQARSFRHDMQKHLSMAVHMIHEGEIDKLLSYLKPFFYYSRWKRFCSNQ